MRAGSSSKTTDFTILFLFSIGITKGKWGSLVSALCDFKRDYDANLPLDMAIPSLAKAHGSRYAGMGLKADTMFAAMEQLGTTRLMSEAFSILPKPEMAGARLRASGAGPRRAGHARGTGRTHGRHRRRAVSAGHSAVDAGRERGPADGPVLGYLKALEAYDRRFPGFAHDTHGVEVEDGTYRVLPDGLNARPAAQRPYIEGSTSWKTQRACPARPPRPRRRTG